MSKSFRPQLHGRLWKLGEGLFNGKDWRSNQGKRSVTMTATNMKFESSGERKAEKGES